jgi:hypothetical protein
MTDINPANAVKGPCRIWVGAFGVTEPALSNAALIADPSTGWTFCGATSGGATWEIAETVTKTIADQAIDPIMGRVTARTITLTTNLLESTMANLALALNSLGTTTVGTGITSMTAGQPNAATPLGYVAVLFDGWAPLLPGGGAARRRAIFRKCLNDPKVQQIADPVKDGMFALSMSAFYVSSTIDPFIVEDQTA